MLTGMQNDEKDRIKQAFAARFHKALKELGYSYNKQNKMKRLFGVSGQAVRKWAEGQSMPTSSRMPHVAEVLGVRRAWLQDGEEPMFPTVGKVSERKGGYGKNKNQEFSISGKEVNLLRMYRALTLKQKRVVREIVATLVEKCDRARGN
jgi:transcriptional regulator with XRE-family HTH domain